MKKEIDEKLLASLQAQDPKGLEEAIRRYSPYVAGVLRKPWALSAPGKTWKSWPPMCSWPCGSPPRSCVPTVT